MSSLIKLVQNDTGPDIDVTLVDPDNNNTAINLTAASINFYFRQRGSSTLKATIVCTKPNGGSDGIVRITWTAGALDTAGDFEGEFEITNAGKIQTVERKLLFRVRAQIG